MELSEAGRLQVQPSTATSSYRVGDLDFCVEDRTVHSVRWAGVEVVRGVSAPVRDRDWGTVAEIADGDDFIREDAAIRIVRRFLLPGSGSRGSLQIEGRADGRLTIDWTFEPGAMLEVNRAGLCVLHPLVGVEGTALQTVSPDGTVTQTAFPRRISPGQPAMNVVGLRHHVFGISVEIDLVGDVFEMEDQRNWSDASYKTYCRPLSRPFPYQLKPSQTVRQRLLLRASGKPDRSQAGNGGTVSALMPEILLAAEPGWMSDAIPDRCSCLARFGPDGDWHDDALRRLSAVPFDAEIVVPAGRTADEALNQWSTRFETIGLKPRHVVALPEPFLKSYQPDGPWPGGPTPDDCARAARAAFPEARIGVGMLTNFTELNRRPPTGGLGDYVTHGNSAIVHAADDRSVLQTLEATPSVFASARAIGGDRDYRLGLCAIGMRSNPYGAGLQDNTDNVRKTMTADDPRQASDFAAAYAIVIAAQAASVGAEAVCLGAPAGSFAIAGPLERAVGLLATLKGQSAAIDQSGAQVVIEGDDVMLVANGTLSEWPNAPGGPLAGASWRALGDGVGA